MSILHVAMFRWKPEVTEAQVAGFEQALALLPDQVGCLLSYSFGRDLGLREGNFDFAVVAELASAEEVDGYLDHPAHLRLVEEHVQMMLAERRAVQLQAKPHHSFSTVS